MEGNGCVAKPVDMRFRRLEAHEVIMAWDMLWAAIKRSELYSDDRHLLALMMESVGQRYQCWIFRDADGLKGVFSTKMFTLLGKKTLMLMHANTIDGGIDDSGWALIHEKLLQFAAGERCHEIEIYTDHPRLKALLRKFDFAEKSVFRKAVPLCPVAEQAAT